ncbi:MAG: tetratricopeptide repeat protein [bacterium]
MNSARHRRTRKCWLALAFVFQHLISGELPAQEAGLFLPSDNQQAHAIGRRVTPAPVFENLDKKYAEGLTALHARDWPRAQVAFETLLTQAPDYRDTRRLLAQAQQGSAEATLAHYYVEGLKARSTGETLKAASFLRAVHKMDPDFRDAASLLAEIEAEIQELTPADAPAEGFSALPPDSLQMLAKQALAHEDWFRALAVLGHLEKLEPDNHEVKRRLKEARAQMQIAQLGVSHVEVEGTGKRFLLVAGALAAVFGLPMAAAFAFSSTNRARFHLMRGNFKRAAQLYENLLLRRPDRISIYPRLAQLYLLLGRHDEAALRVFNTIVRLNLPMPQRQSINDVLASSYLRHRRVDQEAIEVLETPLREELQRHNRT